MHHASAPTRAPDRDTRRPHRASAAAFRPGSVHLILGGRDKGADWQALIPLIRSHARQVLLVGEAASQRYWEDGLLVLEDGKIRQIGEASALLPGLPPATPIDDYRGHLVMAGFIDSHIHYSQSQVIASYGAQLLDWLETYAFAEEQKFADPAHGARMAAFFLRPRAAMTIAGP